MAAGLVAGLWLCSAVATFVVGVLIGTSLTDHEGLVLVLSAVTAPTSWFVLLLVTALSLRVEFFSSSVWAWLLWVGGVTASGGFQVWVYRRVKAARKLPA